MSRYVFVTDELPRPGEAGHLAMNHAIVAWLAARGHEVTVLLNRPRLPRPVFSYAGVLDRRRVRVEGRGLLSFPGVVAAPAAAPRIVARRLVPKSVRRRAYGGVDEVLGRFISADEAAWCAARIGRLGPRAVLVDTIFRAGVLADPALTRVASVVIAHDVFHRRHAALTQAGYRLYPASLTAADEVALLSRADAVAAIQPEEAALLRAMLPGTPVFTAGMPVGLRPRPAGLARIADRLVFLGSETLPNADGVRWFLAEIWPALRALRPGVTLDVAGTVGRAVSDVPDGVTLLGRVADLSPVLHRASLGIAPLRAGSGLKIKLLDYLAHGLAVAATPAAASGMGGEGLLIADDMAPVIAAALAEPAEARDAVALNHARLYGAETVFAELAINLGA